jgi:poly(A) polymerase
MVEPLIIPRPDHSVSRTLIDADALRILYRLHSAGFEAYVVGGAIRDMLRGREPKDFDIATNASPNQIRRLFRNSRTIGRRFRLVHIYFDDKNIEVSTLRRSTHEADEFVPESDAEGDLYVHDDNCWGDVESDAFRRDFTINALFYDIADFSVIDYVGGVEDLKAGLIRCLGEPELRFREDPVRMLRAIKFAARFGFRIEEQTARAIHTWKEEILKASPFRVTEELFRIISQKNRHVGLRLLREYGMIQQLWPTWLEAIGDDGFEQVCDFSQRVNEHANHGDFVPLEVTAAGLFLPLLDVVDIDTGNYNEHAARLAEELQTLAVQMDMPRRLTALISVLLRGQLYLLYFVHRRKQVQKFVRKAEFDWVWRFSDLAFGHLEDLQPMQEMWLREREALGTELHGWVDHPDARDVFSFRGKTGGGRHGEGEQRGVIRSAVPHAAAVPAHHGGRSRRRRRSRG